MSTASDKRKRPYPKTQGTKRWMGPSPKRRRVVSDVIEMGEAPEPPAFLKESTRHVVKTAHPWLLPILEDTAFSDTTIRRLLDCPAVRHLADNSRRRQQLLSKAAADYTIHDFAAILCQIVGFESPKPCDRCSRGLGQWDTCVKSPPGLMFDPLDDTCANSTFQRNGQVSGDVESDDGVNDDIPRLDSDASTVASEANLATISSKSSTRVSTPRLQEPVATPRTPKSETKPKTRPRVRKQPSTGSQGFKFRTQNTTASFKFASPVPAEYPRLSKPLAKSTVQWKALETERDEYRTSLRQEKTKNNELNQTILLNKTRELAADRYEDLTTEIAKLKKQLHAEKERNDSTMKGPDIESEKPRWPQETSRKKDKKIGSLTKTTKVLEEHLTSSQNSDLFDEHLEDLRQQLVTNASEISRAQTMGDALADDLNALKRAHQGIVQQIAEEEEAHRSLVEDLNAQLTKKTKDLWEVQTQVTRDAEEFRSSREVLLRQIEERRKDHILEIESLNNRLDRAAEAVRDAKDENTDISQALQRQTDLTAEAEETVARAKPFQELASKLQDELRVAEQSMEKLREQISTQTQQFTSKILRLETDNQKLEEEIHRHECISKEAAFTLSIAQQSIDKLREDGSTQAQQLTSKVSQLENDNQTLKEEVHRYESVSMLVASERRMTQQSMDKLRDDMSSQTQEFTGKISQLETDNHKLKAEVDRCKSTQKEALRQQEMDTSQIRQLKVDNAYFTSLAKDLEETRSDEAQVANAKAQDLKVELEATKEKLKLANDQPRLTEKDREKLSRAMDAYLKARKCSQVPRP